MLEEAWRDAEKEDVPDVKRALKLVSHIEQWLNETASPDKYWRYFKDGMFREVALQTVGMTKTQISNMRYKLQIQGEDDWSRPTHLGGHWELGINSLKAAREYLEVMGAKKPLKETSLYSLQETTTRILKYEAAGYAIVVAAPVVIGAAIQAGPLLSTEALTAAGLRIAPRIMFWAARNPILATEVGTAVVGTALQVGEDKYLDPVQLIFNLLHIYYASLPGGGRSGPPAPNVPRQEAEPDFIITGAPKLDQQTGKITASVVEKASGRQLDAELNITTASGRITDQKTGQMVGTIDLNTVDVGKLPPAQPVTPPAAAPVPAPQLAGKTQTPPPAQVTVPIVSAPRPKNENITARTDIERARDKRAALMRRPQAQTQRQVLAATGSTRNVAPAKIIGSGNTQGNASGTQIVASGEGKPPGPLTPVPGSVQSSETSAPTQSRAPSATRPSGEFDINEPTDVDLLPAGASVTPPQPVNQNVIRRPLPEQAPTAAEVVPPAPPRSVNQNVIRRPAPEQTPAPPATSSRQPGVPDEFEATPTGVALERPGQELRGAVRPSGGGPSPAQVGTSVSGEITEPPAGGELAPAHTETAQGEISTSKFAGSPAETRAPGTAPSPPALPSRRAALEGKPDWNKLPVPEGFRRPDGTIEIDRFGREVIQWGSGMKEAQNLVQMLNTGSRGRQAYLEGLRNRGVTPEMARAWAQEYLGFAKNNLNRTAPWRAELLRLIAELL
jgi:hypothetical protein